MSRILAISDIHIHDYPQRNPNDKYRLYQSRIVAQNIIEAGKTAGADIIVIAGDVIEKPVIRPYVLAEVKFFLDTIMSNFKEGYIIWGNHDQDNKGVDQNFIDSALSVMLPKNLYYADKREITIDNSRIAFSNWQPEFNLDWIKQPVDVLFTHATICYSGSGSEYYKSQTLDESKFNLAICGDIHKPGKIGKYMSIGVPQRCKMTDSETASGIVYDCTTKTADWIDLNPHNNLMKFEYTPVQSEDGWYPEIGTWKVYKPDTLGIKNGVRDISVPAWEEVGHLVDGIISTAGLESVHQEVLKHVKDIDANGVDFNFTLTRFYCKNWRSIEEVELFFNEGDKILITGKNGSGKSSLLSAIRYAFVENKFIKDFTQFGAKDCYTEVDFIYQGNNYRIGRGSSKYGLWVNGEAMKYNNKSMFNEDVRQRFPFISYMDIFFFDSDHHKLIGDMTPERKSEIIFKFFKLDRIDTLNEVSGNIIGEEEKKMRYIESQMSNSKNLLDFIEKKIAGIQLPSISKEESISLKEEGLKLQKKSDLWKLYESELTRVETNIQINSNNLKTLEEKLKGYDSPENMNNRLLVLDKEIEGFEKEILDNSNIEPELNRRLDRINSINKEGSMYYEEWKNADSLKICSKCGQPIKNPETVDNYKRDLETKMNNLMAEKTELEKEVNSLKEKKLKVDPLIVSLKRSIRLRREEIVKINTNLEQLKDLTKEIESLNKSLKYLIDVDLKRLNSKVPEKIILPEDFITRMTDLERIITTWNEYESLVGDKNIEINKINQYQAEIDKIKSSIEGLVMYNKLTGPTGKIFEEIMTRLAQQFSDTQVKYEVNTYTFRKIDHLDLTSSFNNNGNYVSYQACSSGQKTVLDINFLSKIVTRLGLLVMDEFLKHLDPMNHDTCIELISSMNIGCVMLSSHMESIVSFNNKSCNLELNDSGITKISLI